MPVEGSLPAFGALGGPALGEPELGAGVAVVVDESEVLSACGKAVGEGERAEEDGVAGGFVVEGEGVGRGGVGGDADFDEAGSGWGEDGPGRGRQALPCPAALSVGVEIGGVEGIGEEGVLDVGGDELLMLLLVLEAEGHAADGFVVDRGAAARSCSMAASTWAR